MLLFIRCEKGGDKMSYISILNKVAKEHKTTPEAVDKEIREAIKYTGMDIEPEAFIKIISAKVKVQMAV